MYNRKRYNNYGTYGTYRKKPATEETKASQNADQHYPEFTKQIQTKEYLHGHGSYWSTIKKALPIAGLIGGGLLGGVPGMLAGGQIGQIIGHGGYQLTNPNLGGNIGTTPPVFFGRNYLRVRYREFLTTVQASTDFVNNTVALNPGLHESFPWLSVMAKNWNEWMPKGLILFYLSRSVDALDASNLALGLVILAMEPNPLEAPYADEREMRNSEYAVACKPSLSINKGFECDPKLLARKNYFIRTQALPSGADISAYDVGNFQYAVVGCPAAGLGQVIGEAWLSHDICLYRPQLALTSVHGVGGAAWDMGEGVIALATSPLGTEPGDDSLLELYNTIGLTAHNGTTQSYIGFPAGTRGNYQITCHWENALGATVFAKPPGVTGFNMDVTTLGGLNRPQNRMFANGYTAVGGLEVSYNVIMGDERLPGIVYFGGGSGTFTSGTASYKSYITVQQLPNAFPDILPATY